MLNSGGTAFGLMMMACSHVQLALYMTANGSQTVSTGGRGRDKFAVCSMRGKIENEFNGKVCVPRNCINATRAVYYM